jgi:hypothetical protein
MMIMGHGYEKGKVLGGLMEGDGGKKKMLRGKED